MNPTITITLKQYDEQGRTKILEVPDALVDTGATQSYISLDSLPKQMATEKLSKPEIIGNAFSDKISSIREKLTVNLFLNNCNIEIPKAEFYVVERQMKHNAIIGMDILQNFKIDLREDNVKFINNILHAQKNQEVSTIIFEKEKEEMKNAALSCHDIEVAPHSDRKLYFSIKLCELTDNKKFFNYEYFTENGVFVNLMDSKKNMVNIQNRTNSIVIIEKGAKIGFFQSQAKHHNLNFLLTEKELEPFERITHQKKKE